MVTYTIQCVDNGYILHADDEDEPTRTLVLERDDETDEHNETALYHLISVLIENECIGGKYSKRNIDVTFPVDGRGVEVDDEPYDFTPDPRD